MKRKTVLFVDDEIAPEADNPSASYMWYYLAALRNAGIDVQQATGPDAALSILESSPRIDLLVIDLLMPIGDELTFDAGYRLAREMRHMLSDVPIVILTNATATAPMEKLNALPNVRSILFKPDAPPLSLVREIERLLDFEGTDLGVSVPHSADSWRDLMQGRRMDAFQKFLSDPNQLTQSEFLLLADVNHSLIRQLIKVSSQTAPLETKWSRYSTEQLVAEVSLQEDAKSKGEILEYLVSRLFSTVPGFEVKTRLKTRTEEIDIFILNGSADAPWRDMGPAIIGECKNWSDKCAKPEYNDFESKLRDRHGQCKCGFFISWNGFTQKFVEQGLRASREDYLVITLDGSHLREAVTAGGFQKVITRLWEESLRV